MEIAYTKEEHKCTECRDPAILTVKFDSGRVLYLCKVCRDYCGIGTPQLPFDFEEERWVRK